MSWVPNRSHNKYIEKSFIQKNEIYVWMKHSVVVVAYTVCEALWRLVLVKRVFPKRLHRNCNSERVNVYRMTKNCSIDSKLWKGTIDYCFTLCGKIAGIWNSNQELNHEWLWCASNKNNLSRQIAHENRARLIFSYRFCQFEWF